MARSRSARRADDGGAPRRRPSSGGILLAFLLGVVVTTLVAVALLGIGVATVGDAEEAMDASPAATPTATSTATATATQADEQASGTVPRSCVEAAEYNETFTEALDQIAVGVRDQDARALQEALDAVQDAKPGSEAASEECQTLAQRDGSDGSTSDETRDADDTETPGDTETPSDTESSVEPVEDASTRPSDDDSAEPTSSS